ncbi:MAG: MBOAT family protein [Acidimicrobiia bacterium]|nr:MBOAT family protein [Acidimicrobiia bacterium]
MLFPSVDFAVFFLVVFTGNWILRPNRTLWLGFLLGSSFVFYGWWDWRFCFLLGGSILFNWWMGGAVARALGDDRRRTDQSRWLVRAAVATNLGVLAYFKYAEWGVRSVADGLASLGVAVDPPLLEIILPLGISFFTFQALSYVIDIGRGTSSPLPLLPFATYLSFFPQLVAGPIVRANELAPQFDERADPRYVEATRAFLLIFRGLFKKVVIADFLATEIVNPVFANPSSYSGLENLVAVYAFAIQIYADFSAYTDIAIGVALLLGFRLPENFNAPYIASSLQDFWRRWHMTLSRWLRDYLYIPLGGNRLGVRRMYVNLGLTMVLGGLWHGAEWTMVIWGAIHGGFLAAERATKAAWHRRGVIGLPPGFVRVAQWLLTIHVVCLAWIFFRAESFGQAMEMLGRILSLAPANVLVEDPITTVVLAAIFVSLALQFVPQRWVDEVGQRASVAWPAAMMVAITVLLTVTDALGPEGVAEFIYFQF